MQAIQTHYLGPTGRRGSAIKAFTDNRKLTVPYEHEFSVEWNHRTAAVELAEQMGWPEPLLMELEGGALPNGDYAWVAPMRRRPGLVEGDLGSKTAPSPHGGIAILLQHAIYAAEVKE